MDLYALELKQLVEVKLLRLNKPKIPGIILPLSGSYNSIENLNDIEYADGDINNRPANKFKDYNLNDDSSVSIDNMFQISSSFGKVLFCENLEALLIINNTSDKEIKIRDLKIKVSNEVLENYEAMFKKAEFILINTNSVITIGPNHFYNHRIKLVADTMCKYSLEAEVQYTSSNFNDEFIKQTTSRSVKTIASDYFIETGTNNVVKKYYKKFIFATMLPFRIKDRFINDSLENTFIEVNIVNQSPYTLHVNHFSLSSDNNMNSNFISSLAENKEMNLESDEEINIVYMINNYNQMLATVNKLIT